MSSAAPVLAALVAGPASILFAAVSLAQFKYVYLLLSDLATRRSKIYLLSLLRPGLRQLIRVLESSLGPASKFVPNTTHVLLVALIIVVAFSVERILVSRSDAAAARRR